ncbi:venom carboxylesterase-6-like [Contarinia nasturtii]|uniref:venom carboxylesterase-6-like n=1 Tax=Contarinia nasturtii TaxID=265458 RepID=UPI0012D39339|nr:venom carboxylesterase-6-like [Contarinia nasturtii]
MSSRFFYINLILCSFVVFFTVNCEQLNDLFYKTVETENGAVRGLVKKTLLHQKPYYSYRGIPFAKPPLGELRFKAPEPAEPWTPNTFDAFEYGKSCSQLFYPGVHLDISENCLFVNVFVPAINSSNKLPVMLYIFGGAFNGFSGSDFLLGPDFLVERDMILVTFNHRVGAFGFMSLGTPEYSGNMGLKDQLLAMKWVYENIDHFGGDKDKITLVGHSSGGASVTFHMLNDESKKYYQQAMAMSGVAQISHQYLAGNHRCVMNLFAKKYSKWIGDSLDDLIELLKNVPEHEILEFANEIETHPHDKLEFEVVPTFNRLWWPIIESDNAIRPFLQEDPATKLENIDSFNITSYFTFTNREMLGVVPPDYADAEVMDAYLKDFRIKLPIFGYDLSIARKPYLKDVLQKFHDFFFANAKTNYERADQRLLIDSDFSFTYFIEKWLRKQASVSDKKIFYHQYSADSTLNARKPISLPGSAHADEICYIFRCRDHLSNYKKMLKNKYMDEESALNYRLIDVLTTLISNFVKYGEPAINGIPIEDFGPIQLEDIHFLNITNDGLFMAKSPNERRIDFYDNFIAEVKELVEANGDTPKQTIIEQFCDSFQSNHDQYCSLDSDPNGVCS